MFARLFGASLIAVRLFAGNITPGTVPGGQIGKPYTVTFVPAVPKPYDWTMSPPIPGLTFTGSGPTATLSGTPTQNGVFFFTLNYTYLCDPGPGCPEAILGIASYVLNVGPLKITNTSFEKAAVGTPFFQGLAATGGNPPYTWKLDGVPPGLTLKPAGDTVSIQGVPTCSGTFNVGVTVLDKTGGSDAKTFTLTITGEPTCQANGGGGGTNSSPATPYSITTPSFLTPGTKGQSYPGIRLETAGSAGEDRFAITAGKLPAGVILNQFGVFAGTPAEPGISEFTVEATDKAGKKTSKNFTLGIYSGLRMDTTGLPRGTKGQDYPLLQARATGGTLPYIWIATGLPPGVTMNADGVFGGKPTTEGTYKVTLTVQDSGSLSTSADFVVVVDGEIPKIDVTAVPTGRINGPYSFQLAANGGAGGNTWTVISGKLPKGITLQPGTGLLSGKAEEQGAFDFEVQVKDFKGGTDSKKLTLTVTSGGLSLGFTKIPGFATNVAQSFQIVVAGGNGTYTYQVTGLPDGMKLDEKTGIISGTPVKVGSYSIAVTVRDSAGAVASGTFATTVFESQRLVIDSPPELVFETGVPASFLFLAGGGSGAGVFSAAGLPDGLSLDATGWLRGTPTKFFSGKVTITYTQGGNNATLAQSIVVSGPGGPLAIPQPDPVTGFTGQAVDFHVKTFGKPPITFALTGNSPFAPPPTLPPGLRFDPDTGHFTGTIQGSGYWHVRVLAKDSSGAQAFADIEFAFNDYPGPPDLSVQTAGINTLTAGTVVIPLATTGGVQNGLRFRLVSAPPGVQIDASTGALTIDTAKFVGSIGNIRVQVEVNDGVTPVVKELIIPLVGKPASFKLNITALPDATVGQFYSQEITLTGGNPPFVFNSQGLGMYGLSLLTTGPSSARIEGFPTYSNFQWLIGTEYVDFGGNATRVLLPFRVKPGNVPQGVGLRTPNYIWEGPVANGAASLFSQLESNIAAGPSQIAVTTGTTIAVYENPIWSPGPPSRLELLAMASTREFLFASPVVNSLDEICPTRPRTEQSCVMGNMPVIYDAHQGRFIWATTLVDTGGVAPAPGNPIHVNKSGIVIGVSKGPGFSIPTAQSDTGNNFDGYVGILPLQALVSPNQQSGDPNIKPDCSSSPGQDLPCYFPTGIHLGIDNDNIILTLPLIDLNAKIIPGTLAGQPASPAFVGTRARVIKKASIYGGMKTQLQAGDPNAPNSSADYYDLLLPASVPDTPFSVFFEPARSLGRPLGSLGDAPPDSGIPPLYLLGAATSDSVPQNHLYLQTINFGVATDPATGIKSTYPILPGAPVPIEVPSFTNPGGVPQLIGANSMKPPPFLYVGDSRPSAVIFREGQLYSARTVSADLQNCITGQCRIAGVVYDIVQKPTSLPLKVVNVPSPVAHSFNPILDTSYKFRQEDQAAALARLQVLQTPISTTIPALTGTASPNDPRCQGVEQPSLAGVPPINVKSTQGDGTLSNLAYPGLLNLRCGQDAFDLPIPYLDPLTGLIGSPRNTFPGGGSTTDPNTGALWVFGMYARAQTAAAGWGTVIANYDLQLPSVDPNNSTELNFDDVPVTDRTTYLNLRMLRDAGIIPAPAAGVRSFGVNQPVTRAEAARWITLSVGDEARIAPYLSSMGLPRGEGFTDVSPADPNARYIEMMRGLGITKGCQAPDDPVKKFCPDRPLTQGELATFIMRAKLNNLFPASLGTCASELARPPCAVSQDNFISSVPQRVYFNGFNPNDPAYPYVQIGAGMGIFNVIPTTDPGSPSIGFGPVDPVTRRQAVAYLARAFFY